MSEKKKTEVKNEQKKNEEKKAETEQMYLEMCDQLKKKYDEVEYMKTKLTMQNTDLKKEILTAYGISRLLDNLISNCYDVEMEVVCLSESLRGHLSNVIDDII